MHTKRSLLQDVPDVLFHIQALRIRELPAAFVPVPGRGQSNVKTAVSPRRPEPQFKLCHRVGDGVVATGPLRATNMGCARPLIVVKTEMPE